MISKERSDQVFGGTFLIGLAILFVTGWWFPGILIVGGVASLARSYAEGKPLNDNTGALIALAVGGFFMIGDVFSVFGGNWFPLILILIGGYMLFGNRERSGSDSSAMYRADGEKPKNDMV